MSDLTRRAFLKVAGLAGVALASGCQAAGPAEAPADQASSPRAPQAPPSPPTEILITPTGELYTQSYSKVPAVDGNSWRLKVHGLVRQAAELDMDAMRAFPKVEQVRTLECIGNPVGGPLIGNVVWGGFEARHLWDQVGLRPEAVKARFGAADGYETSVAMQWITQPGVLLAYEVNGGPLPREHGFPLRILMPGLYGQKMPKWITEIEFIDRPHVGYWESRGWSEEGTVQTNSIIRRPRELEDLPAGALPVYGVAFAGLRRIVKVEVRVDDGEWQPAVLMQADSPLVWTQWSFSWDAPPGRYRVAVRATDEEGFVQSTGSGTVLSSAFPDGTSDIHDVVVNVYG